ncbi:MAG: hypothetical protein FWF81_02085 [Defluviitaleaceae bacterium]|nr:hypothetical protein [Defluviitaleaceae bacterium]
MKPNQDPNPLYDKIQLIRLNNHAFETGIIDEKTKTLLAEKIWASN